MLPSAGFFEKVNCPFYRRAVCERPFCQYKHGKDESVFVAPYQSPFTKAAGTGVNHLSRNKTIHQNISGSIKKDPCLLELERINKEIETVKCEVEKEQRRLSHYKNLQGDSNSVIPYSESWGKKHNLSNRRTSCTQRSAVVRSCIGKYVLDNSRPRTDLEYDPLSNYAADMRSNNSGEHKPQLCGGSDEKHGMKRVRENLNEDQSELVHLDLEDSDDEGVLVIDIPPLEVKAKNLRSAKLQKTLCEELEDAFSPVSVPSKASEPEQNNIGMRSDLNCSPPSPVLTVKLGNECEQSHISNVFEDISKCLETLRSESEKITQMPKMEPVQISKSITASDCSGMDSFSWSLKDAEGNLKCNSTELPSCDEKGNPPFLNSPLSIPDLTEINPATNPLPLNADSNIQGNSQQGAGIVEGYWTPMQHAKLPCLQKATVQLSEAGFPKANSVPSLEPKDNDTLNTTTHLTANPLLPTPSTSAFPQPAGPESPEMHKINEPCATSDLSSEEEVDYSDVDLSDSDPMEECYRIFMEANQAEQEAVDNPENSPVEASNLEKPEEEKPLLLAGPKKRVAHISKHNGVNKNRQQVIVPLRGAAGHSSNPGRIPQLQQKATALTAAMKGGQAFVAATTGQKKPIALAPAPQQIPVQTTCVNIIPVGATIQLGSNVHFIIPEGNIALPVSPVPTPVVPAQQSTLTSAKPIAIKRKLKARPESSTKVPHDIRQRYVNLFVEEFLKTSFTVQDAFEKALAEEKIVYDRSINKLKYLSVAVNALKKLKNQNAPSVKASSAVNVQESRGKIGLRLTALQANDPGLATLYEQLKEHILSEAGLKENGYPLQHPEKPGRAVLYGEAKKGSTDPMKRICCRCGATFSVSQSGRHVRKEECNYHYGKVKENKVPGGMETRYTCCEGAIGTPGCQVFKLHVHDAVSLYGFVSSPQRSLHDSGCPGVFALDCEMCYTTHGLELARVTVVNSSLQVIYDTFVKPDNEVIDYNTRFSGVTEEDLIGCSSSIRDVQEVLQSFISADTILIGHSLEKDLCALKLLHGTVVDVAVVFPHRLGLPHKRGLCSLTADYLRRIIQESVKGRDSGEDAAACMELMLWKVKEDAKVKRW